MTPLDMPPTCFTGCEERAMSIESLGDKDGHGARKTKLVPHGVMAEQKATYRIGAMATKMVMPSSAVKTLLRLNESF